MEQEALDNVDDKILYEKSDLLGNTDESKNVEQADLKKILREESDKLGNTDESTNNEEVNLDQFLNEEDIIIIEEVFCKKNHDDDDDIEMVVEDEISQEKNDGVSNTVEANTNINIIETINEKNDEKVGENSEIEVKEVKKKPKQEVDFVSDDVKENSDNFDAKWNHLKYLCENDNGKYDFIQKRWGNSTFPDPSVDLTYRHRKNSARVRGRSREISRNKLKGRSLSCVSHMEKLMNDIKSNYYNELKKLCERHCLIMSEIQRNHQKELARLLQNSLQYGYVNQENAKAMLLQQKQDEVVAFDVYQKQIQELVNRTSSILSRYEKNSEEILVFHNQYHVNGNGLLKNEQFLHLQETERMYKEFDRFYK